MKRLETIAYFAVLLGPRVVVIMAIAVVAVLVALGCTAVRAAHARPDVTDSRGIIWNDSRCFELLNAADNWTFVGKVLVGTGGAAAVGAPVGGAISDDEKEQNRIVWGLDISAAVAAGVGLTAIWMGERKRDEFEEYCQVVAVKPEDVPEHPASDELELAPSPFEGDGGVN